MQETLNLSPNGAVLEALCGWSDNLKSFQQRLGRHHARVEAPWRSLRLHSSKACVR